MQPISFKGMWWLPERPDECVSGDLAFDPDTGTTLHLLGSLRSPVSVGAGRTVLRFDDDEVLNVVHGLSEDGVKVTLSRCRTVNSALSMPGLERTTVHVEMLLYGKTHVDSPATARFSEASFSFAHLTDWIRVTGIRPEVIVDRESGRASLNVRCAADPTPKQRLNGASVQVGFEIVTDRPEPGLFTARETPFIHLEFDEPLGLSTIVNTHGRRLELLLALALGESVAVTDERVTLACDALTAGRPNAPLDLAFSSVGSRGARRRSRQRIPEGEMLFRYEDVRDQLGAILSRWNQLGDRLSAVFDLYAAAQLGNDTFLEHQLLSYAQAIEVYHRDSDDLSGYLAPSEFRAVRERLESALPADLPTEIRDAFAMKLGYLNHRSFRDRVLALLRREREVLAPFVPDDEELAALIRDVRNHYTHFEGSVDLPHGEDLYWLMLRMRLILEVCLMRELGFETTKISALLSRNTRYRRLHWAEAGDTRALRREVGTLPGRAGVR